MINSTSDTTVSKDDESQPSTIAPAPTPLDIRSYVKAWAIVDAATLAICCQKLARIAMSAEINEQTKAT